MRTANTRPGRFFSIARALRTRIALAFPLVACLSGCGGAADTPLCSASTTPQAAMEFCAPQTIAASQTLRLQIREQCGSCTQRATHCEAVVQGQEVKLRLLGEECILSPGSACAAICATNVFDCAVPPLAAGTYRVTTAAGSTTVSMMTADPTVSATACSLPQWGAK